MIKWLLAIGLIAVVLFSGCNDEDQPGYDGFPENTWSDAEYGGVADYSCRSDSDCLYWQVCEEASCIIREGYCSGTFNPYHGCDHENGYFCNQDNHKCEVAECIWTYDVKYGCDYDNGYYCNTDTFTCELKDW